MVKNVPFLDNQYEAPDEEIALVMAKLMVVC